MENLVHCRLPTMVVQCSQVIFDWRREGGSVPRGHHPIYGRTPRGGGPVQVWKGVSSQPTSIGGGCAATALRVELDRAAPHFLYGFKEIIVPRLPVELTALEHNRVDPVLVSPHRSVDDLRRGHRVARDALMLPYAAIKTIAIANVGKLDDTTHDNLVVEESTSHAVRVSEKGVFELFVARWAKRGRPLEDFGHLIRTHHNDLTRY